MNRSFAVLAGFEHEAELLTGYDNLLAHHEEKAPMTPEAAYTETVLKLDGGTYGIIDGQEGFLDNIKRGANKVYEWIKSMIRAIRNWFAGFGKKDYNAAKVEVAAFKDIDQVFDKELEDLSVDVLRSNLNDVLTALRSIGIEDRNIVQNEITDKVQELKKDPEKREKIIGTIINEIAAKTSVRLKQAETRVKEIKRIDPTGETLESLGLSKGWNFITDSSGANIADFTKEDQRRFAHSVKTIVEDADDIQSDLGKAVSALDKLNEKNRGVDDSAESRKVARAGSVVKELSEIAGIYRDIIITINSQVQIGLKKAETSIVKSALTDALKHSDEKASKYIQQAIDAL